MSALVALASTLALACPQNLAVSAQTPAKFQYRRLRCGDWWDEDPSSPTYNSFQHVPCGEKPPFGGGSEGMWQQPSPIRTWL